MDFARSTAEARDGRVRRPRRLVLVTAVAVALLAEIAVRLAVGPLPEPQRWSSPEIQYKVGLLEGHRPVSVAVVGSSVMDVSIDPSQLGNAFNAALGAASIGMIADFTRAVVVPDLDPRTVVVGVASREVNPNAPEPAIMEARFRDAPAVRQLLGTESLLDEVARRAADFSALVRYRAALRDPETWVGDIPRQWGVEQNSSSGMYLGFLDAAYRFDAAARQRLVDGSLRDFRVGGAELGVVRQLIRTLTGEGRHVLLMVPPVSPDYVASYPHGASDHAAFLAAMAAVADQTGVPFLDAGVWDRALFADPLHVNRDGNVRVTALVRETLARQNWK